MEKITDTALVAYIYTQLPISAQLMLTVITGALVLWCVWNIGKKKG